MDRSEGEGMKSGKVVVAAAVLTLGWIFGLLLGAGDAPAQDPSFLIESDLYKEHSQPLVEFNHDAHMYDYGYDCLECHHVFRGGENVWTDGDPTDCEECHNEPTVKNEKRLPLPKQQLNLKLAYHKNCIGCHRTYNHENHVMAAPVKCQECHTQPR